ncbi:ferritin-like domain-containing protein [Fictibacillus phosphorivorans]|uniref:ferritin-like domain-containing protein n=1 Tax=Fictibacillus phosphorivorans TaxID=1221500 RepID=UPI002040325D|nr:ferritin-like domain-containing protein [Fictibacillus phosphorivorans]MCM3719480.1 ferritin-like domain-containing protein [Fictibacillus phosphorivorans]MCM3777171.1 ferritin-like domain-containing protein [Fictibacillus phosphorivorans]
MSYMNPQQQTSGQQQALQLSLQFIREAVAGEREDQLFYEYLMSQAPTEEEKSIIATIRDDEKRHNRLFKKIYKDLTGKEVPQVESEEVQRPKTYKDGLIKAIFGELAAVEKYRVIRQGLPNRFYRDILFNIITDEMKHSAKYNYLITLISQSSSSSRITESETEPQRELQEETQTETQNHSQPQSTVDQWLIYINPLVKRALDQSKEGMNLTHLFQEIILSGILVGQGFSPQEANELVEKWERTGESQLLKRSKMLGN